LLGKLLISWKQVAARAKNIKKWLTRD